MPNLAKRSHCSSIRLAKGDKTNVLLWNFCPVVGLHRDVFKEKSLCENAKHKVFPFPYFHFPNVLFKVHFSVDFALKIFENNTVFSFNFAYNMVAVIRHYLTTQFGKLTNTGSRRVLKIYLVMKNCFGVSQ